MAAPRLHASGATISSETVWNDASDGATGGGVSRQFPLPSYQASAKVPGNVDSRRAGRGVPDVCGDADPATGYTIRVDGAEETIGGTSAVAPLWAALIARLNQELGAPLGFVQPRLYALLGSPAFHDITQGNNGSYTRRSGVGRVHRAGLSRRDRAGQRAGGVVGLGVARPPGRPRARPHALGPTAWRAAPTPGRPGARTAARIVSSLPTTVSCELRAGRRRVEQLAGEDPRAGLGQQHRGGVELRALALVDRHRVDGLDRAEPAGAELDELAAALEHGQHPVARRGAR